MPHSGKDSKKWMGKLTDLSICSYLKHLYICKSVYQFLKNQKSTPCLTRITKRKWKAFTAREFVLVKEELISLM